MLVDGVGSADEVAGRMRETVEARGLMVGGPVATPVMQSLLWAAGIALVFAPLGVARFKHRV